MLNEKQIYISVITELELLAYDGITPQEIKIIKEFLSLCKIINLNENIKHETINIRKKYRTILPDSVIITPAVYLDFPLVTSDSAFKKVKELSIVY